MYFRFTTRHIVASVLCLSLSHSSAFASPQDFDGDGKDDLALFDGNTGTFTIKESDSGDFRSVELGSGGSVPVTGDFNNDGTTDFAVFDRSLAAWNFHLSGGQELTQSWGRKGTFPVPADYVGSSCTDLATYSPTTQTWSIGDCRSNTKVAYRFGKPGDVPVPCDYDGDGKADMAVFRTGLLPVWKIRRSSNNSILTVGLGKPGDVPVPANYVGNNRCDVAVYRPSTNKLLVRESGGSTTPQQFELGQDGDHFVPLDRNGDGVADLAVYRPSNNTWYALRLPSTESEIVWTDKPSTDALASNGFPLLPQSYFFGRVAGDYNGDGATDFAVVQETSDAGPQWLIKSFDAGDITVAFGLNDDTPRAGDTNGDRAFEPIALRENSGSTTDWFIYRSESSALQIAWGLEGDVPVVGDFDCDGKDDLAQVRDVNGNLTWFIRGSRQSVTNGTRFGKTGDSVFAADTDGDTCDELVISRPAVAASEIRWFARQIVGNSSTRSYRWGLSGDTVLPPLDYNGDGRDDIMVARANGAGQQVFVRYNARQFKIVSLGAGNVLAGAFSGLLRSELATYVEADGAGTLSVKRFDGDTTTHAVTLVDGTNTALNSEGVPITESGSLSALSDVCPNIVEPYSGFLWKPSSDDSGPPRQGKPAALFKTAKPSSSCIAVYASDGTQVGSLGAYEMSGKYGARFYTGWGCGDRKSGGELASAADDASGSTDVYLERSNGTCIGPINPRARNGSL